MIQHSDHPEVAAKSSLKVQTSLSVFTGKPRMGTEIRRMVAQESVDCQVKYLWAAGALAVLLIYAREQPITSIRGICNTTAVTEML